MATNNESDVVEPFDLEVYFNEIYSRDSQLKTYNALINKQKPPYDSSNYTENWSLTGHVDLPPSAWSQLGQYLDKNKKGNALFIRNCRMSPDSFKVLFNSLGKKSKRSSWKYSSFNNLVVAVGSGQTRILHTNRVETMQHLSSYININKYLRQLTLRGCGLNSEGLKNLLSSIRGSKITHLNLSVNRFGGGNNIQEEEENLSQAVILSHLPELVTLDLSYNQLGRVQSDWLKPLLNLNNSSYQKLESLWMHHNHLTDDACSIIANAMSSKTKLKNLFVGKTNEIPQSHSPEYITPAGWKHFFKLVCDTTSLNNTFLSNHTLLNLDQPWSLNKEYKNLDEMLSINGKSVSIGEQGKLKVNSIKKPKMSRTEKGRFKVAYVHFRGDYNMNLLADIDVEIMPFVIEWVLKECGFRALYHLLRNWDVATSFGFPSKLEMRNKELEELVKKLRGEVAELKEEVSVLKDQAFSRKKQKVAPE